MRFDNCMVNVSLLVTGLWIKFTDANVNTIARSKVRGNDHPDWTPIYINSPSIPMRKFGTFFN